MLTEIISGNEVKLRQIDVERRLQWCIACRNDATPAAMARRLRDSVVTQLYGWPVNSRKQWIQCWIDGYWSVDERHTLRILLVLLVFLFRFTVRIESFYMKVGDTQWETHTTKVVRLRDYWLVCASKHERRVAPSCHLCTGRENRIKIEEFRENPTSWLLVTWSRIKRKSCRKKKTLKSFNYVP